jgi:energy-coupling factor transporter ATP-binding protein EcfA2
VTGVGVGGCAPAGWQAEVMRVFLITGNPGSGKSTLAAELSRRGLVAIDTDDLAFWEDSSGVPVDQPPDADDDWLLAHRWVWSRARIEGAIAAASDGGEGLMFFGGIARNQDQVLDVFEQVFLLMIDEDTQIARLARATSPLRTEAVRRQIREGRPVFEAQMLARGAIPLDGTASPAVLADSLLAFL